MLSDVLITAVIVRLLPAVIAATKGQSFFVWCVYGAVIWPVALVHAFAVKPGDRSVEAFVTGRRLPGGAELTLPVALGFIVGWISGFILAAVAHVRATRGWWRAGALLLLSPVLALSTLVALPGRARDNGGATAH